MFAARPVLLLFRCLDATMAHCRQLIERARDPYRPEQHYMRGPGPKWHARHGASVTGIAL